MGVRVPAQHVDVAYRLQVPGDNEPMIVTMGIAEEDVIGFGQAQAEDLADLFGMHMVGFCGAGYTFTGLTAYAGPDGQGGTFEVVRSVASATAASPLPPNCATLIQKRTASAGRRNRGRMYIPGPPETNIDPAGFYTEAVRSSLSNAAEGWRQAVASANFVQECVIFHQTLPGNPGIAPTAITNLTVAQKIATQRRRLRP